MPIKGLALQHDQIQVNPPRSPRIMTTMVCVLFPFEMFAGGVVTSMSQVQRFEIFGGVGLNFDCFQQVPTGSTPAMPPAGYCNQFKEYVSTPMPDFWTCLKFLGRVETFLIL